MFDYKEGCFKLLADFLMSNMTDEIKEKIGNSLLNDSINSFLERENSKDKVLEFIPTKALFDMLINKIYEPAISFSKMCDIAEVYINRFPYNNTKINKIDHLVHNINCYYNTLYELKEKMKASAVYIARLYNLNKEDESKLSKKVNQLLIDESIEITFRGRNTHLHSYIPNDLSELVEKELFIMILKNMETDDPKIVSMINDFEKISNSEYRKIRGKYKKCFINKNNNIENIIKYKYFKLIYNIINSKGKLKIPNNYKKEKLYKDYLIKKNLLKKCDKCNIVLDNIEMAKSTEKCACGDELKSI